MAGSVFCGLGPALLAMGLIAGLAGCSGTFRANVANQSAHAVEVQLAYTAWTGGTRVLASRRLGPGEAAVLGPARAPRSAARLLALPEGLASPRAGVNIPRGVTTAHVIGAMLAREVVGVDWLLIGSNPD